MTHLLVNFEIVFLNAHVVTPGIPEPIHKSEFNYPPAYLLSACIASRLEHREVFMSRAVTSLNPVQIN